MSFRLQATFWVGALVVLLLFLWVFSGVLLPFILGMALAYLLDPVADRLERIGMSRFWATITILLVSVTVIVLLALLVVPVLVSQLAGFIERLPAFAARLKAIADWFLQTRIGQYLDTRQTDSSFEQMFSQAAAWAASVLGSVWAGGRAVIGAVSLLVVTPVVAFYLLYDWDRMLAKLDALIPRNHVETVRRLAREIDTAIAGFIRGQGTVCLILGVFYAVVLSALGLNFGLLIGAVAGLIGFIPFVGSLVGFVLAVGVALVQFWPDWIWILVIAGVFALGQFLEGNILQPRLVGQSIGVHPVWLMFSLFAFGALFGFVGVLLAVPMTAAISVLVRFAVRRYRDSGFYWGRDGGPPDARLL